MGCYYSLSIILFLTLSYVSPMPQSNASNVVRSWKPFYFQQNWISNNNSDEPPTHRHTRTNLSHNSFRKIPERKVVFPENVKTAPVINDRNGVPENVKINHHKGKNETVNSLTESRITREGEQSDIVFPGPNSRDTSTTNVPNHSCEDEMTFCESAGNDYPLAVIEEKVANSGNKFQAFFGDDELYPDVEIGQRIDAAQDFTLCKANERLIYPKRALNRENVWHDIVNTPDKQQGIRVETCVHQGPCNDLIDIPASYETTCTQKFIQRKLVYLDNNQELKTNYFKMPSCCVCVFKNKDSGLAVRMGFDNPNTRQSPVPKTTKKRK